MGRTIFTYVLSNENKDLNESENMQNINYSEISDVYLIQHYWIQYFLMFLVY